MGDFPSTWFLVHPTAYFPPNHIEDKWVNRIYFTNHLGKNEMLALGKDRCQPLACACSRCSPSKDGSGLGGPLILAMPVLGLQRLNQLEMKQPNNTHWLSFFLCFRIFTPWNLQSWACITVVIFPGHGRCGHCSKSCKISNPWSVCLGCRKWRIWAN